MSVNQIKMANSDCFSDGYLFQQIQNGQYEAMELFFNRYYVPLCRFGMSYESNFCLVEEMVADIFIQLWTNRNILDKIKNPKSYIYVIVKNSLKTARKSQQFCQQIDETKTINYMYSPSREQEIIESEQKKMNTNLIREILDIIPKKSRQAFELSRIDGLKYKEIAEILNVTPKTVENHIAIALKFISRTLESYKKRGLLKSI